MAGHEQHSPERPEAQPPPESPFDILHQWQSKHMSKPVIDLRSSDYYNIKRLRGSASFPLTNLSDLLFELPEPSVPLLLLGDHASLDEGKVLLESRGWKGIDLMIVDTEELWQEAKAQSLLGE